MSRNSSTSPGRGQRRNSSLSRKSVDREALMSALPGTDDDPNKTEKAKGPPPLRAGTSGIYALDQGQTQLWQGDIDGAIESLDKALAEFFAGLESQKENAQGLEAEKPDDKKQRGPRRRSLREGHQKELKEHDVGQVVEFLCLCLSRKGDWEAVLRHANMILAGRYKLNPDHRLNLLMRRAVALSHLAKPTDEPTKRLFNEEMLEQAERDLLEVRERRAKDSTVACLIRQLVFLREQAQGTNHPKEDNWGLDRIRDMEL